MISGFPQFVYEYDFTDGWQHKIRVEAILAPEPHPRYPICINGTRACPPGFELREIALKELERIKWFLWHGNIFRALETVSWINGDIDGEDHGVKQKKLLRKLEEFETYIRNNAGLIVNYGDRWRYGETITTAFVDSTINQVVSKRMVKKQQMRWNQEGPHSRPK